MPSLTARREIWKSCCRCWLLGFGTLFLASCLEPQVLALTAQVKVLTSQQQQILDRLTQVQTQHEKDTAQLSGRLNCTNDAVRDFMRRCEGPDSPGCSDQAIAGATSFMITQPNVLSWMRPRGGISSLVQMRRGEISELVDQQNLFTTTKFLIMVQPRGDTPKMIEEADLIGNQILQFIRVDLGVGGTRKIYGPQLLPCPLKGDAMSRYFTRKKYRAQPTEPQEGEPRLAVWVFRTDCGS